MCTVSFVPKSHGFYLAMNRDEERDRPAALIPTVVKIEGRRAVFPYEPTGGTWISVNDGGVCLALINWYRIQRKPNNGTLSRGLVVRELAGETSTDKIATSVKRLPLRELRPFRLIAIVPGEGRVIEWRWNLQRLMRCDHRWQRQHWFSSGFDQPRAEVERAKTCASASAKAADHPLKRLRDLHRSHAPKRGPFSICMHRADAATVSYTEIAVSKQRVSMRYKSGPPCSRGTNVTRSIHC
jgi:hypothetical protein